MGTENFTDRDGGVRNGAREGGERRSIIGTISVTDKDSRITDNDTSHGTFAMACSIFIKGLLVADYSSTSCAFQP